MVPNGMQLLQAAPIKKMIPKKIRDHGVSHGLGEAGYDIRIKQDILFSSKNGPMQFAVRHHLEDGTRKEDPWTQGRFVLASAIEEFDMPSNLVGIVHDKSTWARKGLSVFNTVIEPGWKGFLTLELVYHGSEDLLIPAGAGIAQVIFHLLTSEAEYTGKYQNQENEPVPPRHT